jgi:DNA-binding MarR family transcriptional regulator
MAPPTPPSADTHGRFSDDDYRTILRFRTRIREFLAWSATQAREAGLTPAQHQLLLAVRGHDHQDGPSVGDIAHYLQLRHHSAVELIDRAVVAGLVTRRVVDEDRRVVRIGLTPVGAEILERLTEIHVVELNALAMGDLLPRIPTTPTTKGDHTPY